MAETNTGRRRGPALLLAGITALSCLAITALLSTSLRASSRQDAEGQFRQSAGQTEAGVREEIRKYFTTIKDVGTLVASVPTVTPEQFNSYVRTAGVFERLPSLVGMLQLEKVEADEYDSFLERARLANPDFSPFPIFAQPEEVWPRYYLMYWVAGPIDLPLPIGAEISPIAAIADVLKQSGETGKGAVGSFQHDPVLQQIVDEMKQVSLQRLLEVDFFIGVPIFAPAEPGMPKGKLLGWTSAPVARFQEVVAQAAKGTPQGLGVSLTVDLTDAGLGQRQDLSRVAEVNGTAGPRDQAAFQQTMPFELDGVTFRLTVWSTSDADDPPSTLIIVLLGGLLASILAAGVMYLRLRAHERERAFAEELADRALFQSEIVDSVTSAMVVLDAEGDIVAANPAWSELIDASERSDEASMVGRSYIDVMATRVRAGNEELDHDVRRVLSGGKGAMETDLPIEQGMTRRWYSVRATPLRGAHGGAVLVHTDITERKRSQDELEFKASRDHLTGLLNRNALQTEIDSALRHARAEQTSAALLFIDLDGFKQINDTYGHAVGDEVLRTVSTRVSAAVRTTDRVARLGGDEFVVLIAPLVSQRAATSTTERILRSFAEPVAVGDLLLPLAASVGIAIVESPLDVSGADLIDRADDAMYRAKQSGGAQYEIAP